VPGRCPAADDVAYGDDADGSFGVEHDEMTEAAVGHGVRGFLQGPRGSGEHDVGGGVGGGGFVVGVLARAERVQDVPLGEDAEAAGVGVEDDGRPDASCGHQPCGLPEGVRGADGEDHRAHGVTDEHGWSHLLDESFNEKGFTSSQMGGLSESL
jgi:hypothetical protein